MPSTTSLDCLLANNEDFSLGCKRLPNMTEYRSISTLGIITSRQGVFVADEPDRFVFLRVAGLGSSGTSGVGSLDFAARFRVFPNNPLPNIRFHPAVFGGPSSRSFPTLDLPAVFGGLGGDVECNRFSGSDGIGWLLVVSSMASGSVDSSIDVSFVGVPRATPIMTNASPSPDSNFSLGSGGVAYPNLDDARGGNVKACMGGTKGDTQPEAAGGGGGDFDAGSGVDEARPKKAEVLRFLSAGSRVGAGGGGLHDSGSPKAIFDSLVLEMLFLRAFINPDPMVTLFPYTAPVRLDGSRWRENRSFWLAA